MLGALLNIIISKCAKSRAKNHTDSILYGSSFLSNQERLKPIKINPSQVLNIF